VKRALFVLTGLAALAGCEKSPTAPSQNTKDTRVLSISGPVAFGSVPVATLQTRQFTVTNTGNSTLHITGVTVSTPTGVGVGVSSGTVFAGETVPVNVIFMPSAATAYNATVTFQSDATSGTASTTVSGTGTVAPGLVAQVFNGSISGGDTRCTLGLSFPFDVGPCQVFDFPIAAAGRVDAILSYNGDDALLSLELYNPKTGDNVVLGDLTFDPYPMKTEHSAFSTNLQPGTYHLRVRAITSTKIAQFAVITTHP
jgi:hypothetical protein